MRIIAATVSCLLSLGGCHDKPSTTSVVRASANGVELIHSRVTVEDGIGRFRCLVSDSGQCHYAIYERGCAAPSPDGSCQPRRLQAFAIAAGSTREVDGLPGNAETCVDRMQMPEAKECLK